MTPITYAEATAMFMQNGQRNFSFIAKPYGVQKTMMRQRNILVAAHPDSFNLSHRPDLASRQQCYRCGLKIRDAEYLVSEDGTARHFCCPVVKR